MKDANDGIPEPIVLNERSKRVTTEFCHDQQEGYRCTLHKGHAGMHESLEKTGIARWPSSHAS